MTRGPTTKSSSSGDKTSSLVLSILSARASDAGWYGCRADNYLGKDVRVRRVDVTGPPSAKPMGRRAAVAGTDLVVHCPYGGHPIDGIRWSRDGEALPVNERQSVFANGTVVIRRVSVSDAGSYVCRVNGQDGDGEQKSAATTMELSVKGK